MVAAAWIISWIASIVLAFWLLSKSPKVPGMSQQAQAFRIAMVVSAFVPCLFLDILWVLGFYGMYRYYTRGMHDQEQLQERFNQTSFDSAQTSQQYQPPTPSANPFTAGQASPDESSAAPQNPRPQPQDNPFMEGPQTSEGELSPQPRPEPTSDNPFLQE